MGDESCCRLARQRRSESYNNAGACAVSLLQLLGAAAVVGLGVAAYVLEERRLKYHGIPIWIGNLFFFTAITGFFSTRKTFCGISLYLIMSILTTVAAAGLLVLFARLLSLSSRYYYCDRWDNGSKMCLSYASETTLMIVEAATLGVFALEFTTGAVGLGLCVCGLYRGRFAQTSAEAQRPAVTPNDIFRTEASMNLNYFSHELATPSAPPEYVVAEEQIGN
ncbi:uncharacterized protein [Diadema antillarum]|uniref:uncharacterized protein n=1 Tax=Diadema antillarum TaxID=105358 RepID=UPI003A8C196A